MKHLGDITRLSGFTLPPVDVVTGGSPCQDLSIAGKRAGLAGERSGLFMEQTRIIKEMREADARRGRTADAIRPRWMVWENVAGAFSSNHGEDFRAVLEEIARIADGDAAIPRPAGGKWANAGAIMGDGWSIAWRVHDAQFWGVPQRRRRIAVVADFAGKCATEILFERKSVCGDFAAGGEAGQGAAAGAESGIENADIEFNGCITPWDCQSKRIFSQDARAYQSLYAAECSGSQNHGVLCLAGNTIDRQPQNGGNGCGWQEDVSYTLTAIDRHAVLPFDTMQMTSPQNGSNPQLGDPCHPLAAGAHAPAIAVMDARGNGDGTVCPTLTGDHQTRITDYTAVAVGVPETFSMQRIDEFKHSDVASAQRARQYKDATDLIVKGEDGHLYVRRLTPTECERLQGYPGGWTDIGAWTDSKGKLHPESSDSARYKALGNSIALPFWRWMLARIMMCYDYPATLGSLFDGIGGFPLCWQQVGGVAVWASEIEQFPIAVTRERFGEE